MNGKNEGAERRPRAEWCLVEATKGQALERRFVLKWTGALK